MRSLVVEDDPLSRMLLHTFLSKYGSCDTVENGEEAVACVEKALKAEKPYDVMCLDIIMPYLDGQEALKQIRDIEREHGIREQNFLKVIMVTAIVDFDNITRAFEEGHCEAYLPKPFREEELVEHLCDLHLIKRDPGKYCQENSP